MNLSHVPDRCRLQVAEEVHGGMRTKEHIYTQHLENERNGKIVFICLIRIPCLP